jgi:aminopeptidase N
MKPAGFILLSLLAASLSAQRLPQTVIPSHYKIALDPRIADQTFSGEETIAVRVSAPAKEIVVNSLDLEISDAELVSGGRTQKAQVAHNQPDEMARLQVADSIPVGEAQIHLKFSGKLTQGLRGLYLSRTARRAYAVTQFEGTYARMMFPCFDEPGFKATFDLSVTAEKGDTAISNGRIVKDLPIAGNRHQITFSTSPKMSTYLVALAIGDWQCLSRTVDGVPIRVCAVPEKKEYGAFGLDVAAHSIQFYDKWYGIKYPFGKLDMVAIPDYEWGGMENTGSIFYRDSALLLDEKTTSVLRRREQATTIAHEIAHQWFGDLVTAAWWDDIWLNEGFATWMSMKPIEAWHPEWNLEDDAAAQAQRIIELDSLATARAIHGNPSTPSEIKEMFDGITYEKGAAVLRMLEAYVGPDVFRKGVNAYLAAHANGNATAADFWQAEAQASGKPIDKIMPTFVMQPGVPLLTFSNAFAVGSEKLQFTQRRFLISGGDQQGDSELWQIPVCVKTGSASANFCATLVQRTQPELITGRPAWTFVNTGAKGYFRVAYTPDTLKAIAAIAETGLTGPERIALVEDTWAMTRADRNTVGDFLDVSRQLRSEQNRHVVDLLASHLRYVGDSVVPMAEQQRFQSFLRAQFTPLVNDLGWSSRPNDTDEQKVLRANLLAILGDAGDPAAIATSRKLVERYIDEPESVDGTLIGSAFSVAAENGAADLYDQFMDALNDSESGDEYYHYLFAIAEFRQPELLERTIALLDQGKIRQQNYPRFFGALLSNPSARDLAWNYLKSHWEDLAQKVTSFGGAGAISALGSACSPEMRDEVKQFFASHRAPGAERAVKQSLERINSCIEFKSNQEQNMQAWLAQQK